jgi:hypothetical protein
LMAQPLESCSVRCVLLRFWHSHEA